MATGSMRGSVTTRVDEKGRLKVPTDYKRLLDEMFGETEYYITSRNGERAEVYPMTVWEEMEAKLEALPSMDPVKRKLEDQYSRYGQVARFDNQGRLLLPQELRQKAKLDGEEVRVIGRKRHLEVVNNSVFEARVDNQPLTTEDEARLASLGI